MTITEKEREIIIRAANILDDMSMRTKDKTIKQRLAKLSTMLHMVWIDFADEKEVVD